jgi:hypothetical protein
MANQEPPTDAKDPAPPSPLNTPHLPAARLGLPVFPASGMVPAGTPVDPEHPAPTPQQLRRDDRNRWLICCSVGLLALILSAACGWAAYNMFFKADWR